MKSVAKVWISHDTSVWVQQEMSPVVVLLDEHCRRASALACVGAGGFILLPYATSLLAMAGEETLFFGVVDLCDAEGEASTGSRRTWARHLVALKKADGGGHLRRLLWCSHGHYEAAPGELQSARVQQAR